MALCDLLLSLSPTTLTWVPLAAVEHIPSAAHLLPFRFVLRLHLLTGHVTTEASLDLGSSPVGLRVIQWDVHDVFLLLGPAALFLLRRPQSSSLSQQGSVLHDHLGRDFFLSNTGKRSLSLTGCNTIFCTPSHTVYFIAVDMCLLMSGSHFLNYMTSAGLRGSITCICLICCRPLLFVMYCIIHC